jgi:hypothetical protein
MPKPNTNTVSENRMDVAAALVRAEQALAVFEHLPFTADGVTTTLTQQQAVVTVEALRLVRQARKGQGGPVNAREALERDGNGVLTARSLPV